MTTTSTQEYMLLSGHPDSPQHPASPQQAAVFDLMRDPRSGSIVLEAVAGAGKTTVIKNALRHLPAGAHVQCLAFNVKATASLKEAVAEVAKAAGATHARNFRAGTFHSVCLYQVRRYLGREPMIDGGKCRKLLKSMVDEDTFETYGSIATKLVGLAKGEGIGALIDDTETRWLDLIERHAIYLVSDDASEEELVRLARRLLERSNEAARKDAVIDYDDMLYLAIRWNLRFWQNDVVFGDEWQDANPIRYACAKKMLKPSGRLVVVGDRFQAIYGFTGASADAMDWPVVEMRARRMPLSVSYRCARNVVARARAWVDHIESSDFAPEGEVSDGVSLDDALAALTASDAVLCRNTAPLVGLAYRVIASGRGCRVLGKDIGEGLVALVKAQKARGIDRLIEKIAAWESREVAKRLAKEDETGADSIRDRAECIRTIVGTLPETERTVPELIRRIEALFADRDGVLTLSTVHKAKGLEWDRVAVLRPDLMPSRNAKTEWQYEQELNLCYVAATRAKLHLMYLA